MLKVSRDEGDSRYFLQVYFLDLSWKRDSGTREKIPRSWSLHMKHCFICIFTFLSITEAKGLSIWSLFYGVFFSIQLCSVFCFLVFLPFYRPLSCPFYTEITSKDAKCAIISWWYKGVYFRINRTNTLAFTCSFCVHFILIERAQKSGVSAAPEALEIQPHLRPYSLWSDARNLLHDHSPKWVKQLLKWR